jgi:putative peptidoglycan lipid II flippase
VSLFGMSVAAAELPELATADRADTRAFGRRLDDGLARIAFYVVISIVVFVVAGDLVVGALFRTGQFGRESELLVWLLLITFSGALVTTTSSRLLQSALYGIGDARTPARVAVQRVVLAAVVGVAVMFQLDRLGIVDGAIRVIGDLPAFGPVSAELRESSTGQIRLGALGLTIGAVAGSWLEFRLLRRALHRHLGIWVVAGGHRRGHLVFPAVAAIGVGLVVRIVVGEWPRILGGGVAALLVVGVYVGVATRTRVAEADALVAALTRRAGPLGRMATLRREQRRRRGR